MRVAELLLRHAYLLLDHVQVGTDANARLLKDSLRECGADLSYLKELEGPSGTAMIMVDPSGKSGAVC